MQTGGLIIKHKQEITDKQVLDILKRQVRSIPEPDTFENVMGPEFHGVAIAYKPGITFVFGRDIAYSLSFEPHEPSKLDERLEHFPGNPEILAFLINTVSDSYAMSLFLKGQRVAAASESDGKKLTSFSFDKKIVLPGDLETDSILEYIKQFSGYYLPDLIEDTETGIKAYLGF